MKALAWLTVGAGVFAWGVHAAYRAIQALEFTVHDWDYDDEWEWKHD